jgi:hypothetical protein
VGFGAGRHSDRRLGFGAVLIAAAVFAVVLARTGAPEHDTPPPPDPVAARTMLALMRAGEGMKSVVTYDFARRGAGTDDRRSQVSEAQLGSTQVTRAGDALDVRTATTTFHCQIVDDTPACTKKRSAPPLADSDVFATAIGTGAYGVTRAKDAALAGEHARCFRVRSVNGQPYLGDIGTETLACFAGDGVVLRKQVAQPNPVDDLVATDVHRRADDAALAPLLAGFEKGTAGLGG